MQKAFSLVELSIVLVVLGLLTGGILAGQSLIRAAELRSITEQFNRHLSASYAFRDKFLALPGDMINAQSFWGIAHATAATCVTTATGDTRTCNGDGNGQIFFSAGSNEPFRVWQHLTNAGLIEGSYDGITHGSTTYSATEENSPQGRVSGTLWYLTYMPIGAGSSTRFNGVYDHSLQIGSIVSNDTAFGAFLKPEEIWNIDLKIDDGKPGLGKMVVRTTTSLSTCTTATGSQAVQAASVSADYLLSVTSQSCAILFRRLF